MSALKLLIVEDDPGLQSQLRWCFENYEVVCAEDRSSALAQLRRHEPAVVLQDLGLPPDAQGVSEGMATLGEILNVAPDTKIIVVTGNGDEDSAIRAVGMGAYDFYQKPVDTDLLNLMVSRAFHIANLEKQNRLLRNSGSVPLQGLLANSQSMLKVCRLVEKVAETSATTLLRGETGTGKELLAQALHRLSGRAEQRFVAINCAAIPENLLESELFGFEKGAFTGAHRQTKGKIELAHQGTLFLDEIGDMPMALQSKMLRFLQERVVERIGGREEIPVDVRVVCATHRNLEEMIKTEGFREDLYYRISEVVVNIPPLREREGDAVLLARSFLDNASTYHGRSVRGFTQDALAAIQRHDWPGNVRELENKVNSAVIMADGKFVTAADLGLQAPEKRSSTLNLRQAREVAERQVLEDVLGLSGGNISKASEMLGVSRPTLYDLLRKHDLHTS